MELFVGALTGTIAFVAVKLIDTAIATRDSATIKSVSAPIWKDLPRAGFLIAAAAIPLFGAHFLRGPVVRSSLQFAGVAALLYLTGKVVTDVAAMALKDNDTAKRLLGPEISAQAMLAASEAKGSGTAGLPDGKKGFAGAPSQAAVDAVKAHAPALVALGSIRQDVAAKHAGKATPEQLARIERVQQRHGQSLAALAKFDAPELEAAVGVAGLQALAGGRPSAPSAPSAPPPNGAPPSRETQGDDGPFNWANNN